MESGKFKFFVKSFVHHPSESLSGWLENELSSLSFPKKYFEFILLFWGVILPHVAVG